MILIGFIYGKVYKTLDIEVFGKIATWLMAPVVTFAFMNEKVPELSVLIRYSVGFFLMVVISFLSARLHSKDRDIIFTGNVYVNSGYLGYPVLMALWGEDALALGVVYTFANVMFGSTMLPAMIRGKVELKNAFRLPFLYAMILGWLLGLAGVSYRTMPRMVLTSFVWLREMAIPFLLLQVGLSMSRLELNKSDLRLYSLVSVERLLLIPTFMLFFTVLFARMGQMENLEAKVFVLESAMPIGVNSVLFVSVFRKEAVPKAGVSVAVTTLFSLLTLPLWAFLLDRLFS